MGVVIQRIRDSAKGEWCAFCGFKHESVVFCHGPRLGQAGMGQKVDDWWGAYGCDECHRQMDAHELPMEMERAFWMHAIQRTQRRLYEKGIMQFPEKERKPRTVSKIVTRKPSWRVNP